MVEFPDQTFLGRNLRKDKGTLVSTIEQVFVDKSGSKLDVGQCLGLLTNRQSGKRDRVKAAIQVISTLLPEQVNNRIEEKLQYTQDKMPFDPKEYELAGKIGSGGMNDVFLINSLKGGKSYHDITEDLVAANERTPSLTWVIAFMAAVSVFAFGIFCMLWTIWFGIGTWNLNRTTKGLSTWRIISLRCPFSK